MRRLVVAVAVATGLAMAGSNAVLADHDHNLITPGTTVVDVANGQTEKCADDPGGHQFHSRVHIGKPGSFGFDQPNNPVDVIKTEDASC